MVKPLVFAVAMERGLVDWNNEIIDCRPDDSRGWRLPGVRRWIRDAHPCGELSPRDVLVQSSNIGAVKVGLRLGRDGMAKPMILPSEAIQITAIAVGVAVAGGGGGNRGFEIPPIPQM